MAYRSHYGASFTTATWTAASLPAGWQAGDTCLAFLYDNVATRTITTPATGWTLLHGPTDAAGGDARGYCYYRVLQGGDTPPAFTWSAAAAGTMILACYSGRHTTTPVEASAADSHAAAGTAVTSSIATTTDLCDIVVSAADDITATNTNWYTGYTGGLTERVEVQESTTFLVSVLADGVRTPAGTSGITITKGTDNSLSFIIALKPAAAAASAFVPRIISSY